MQKRLLWVLPSHTNDQERPHGHFVQARRNRHVTAHHGCQVLAYVPGLRHLNGLPCVSNCENDRGRPPGLVIRSVHPTHLHTATQKRQLYTVHSLKPLKLHGYFVNSLQQAYPGLFRLGGRDNCHVVKMKPHRKRHSHACHKRSNLKMDLYSFTETWLRPFSVHRVEPSLMVSAKGLYTSSVISIRSKSLILLPNSSVSNWEQLRCHTERINSVLRFEMTAPTVRVSEKVSKTSPLICRCRELRV